MKNRLYFVIFLAGVLTSCGKTECECKTLFPDKDSLVSTAAMEDEKINEQVALLFQNKWRLKVIEKQEQKLEKLVANVGYKKEHEQDVEKLHALWEERRKTNIDYTNANKYIRNWAIRHSEFKSGLLELDESKLKTEPYTGSCTSKIKKGGFYYLTAEFENGKIKGNWKYLDKNKKVVKEVKIPED